jgi:hypothetical protein
MRLAWTSLRKHFRAFLQSPFEAKKTQHVDQVVAEFANQPSLSIENMRATLAESESKRKDQNRCMQATRPEPLLWVPQIAEVRHRMNDQPRPKP